MLHFISMGSGSSGNCYLLYTDSDALLIDAGIGVRALKKHLRDYGLSVSRINNILITHDHADHVNLLVVLAKTTNCVSMPHGECMLVLAATGV